MNAAAQNHCAQKEGRSMLATHVVVEGTLRPDGSLELDAKLTLPPGRVQLVVQPLPELPQDDPFWQMMQGIWAAQKARGHVPRSATEVETERQATRDEWEERAQEIQSVQEEARKIREQRA
jgi:hypothetical protein